MIVGLLGNRIVKGNMGCTLFLSHSDKGALGTSHIETANLVRLNLICWKSHKSGAWGWGNDFIHGHNSFCINAGNIYANANFVVGLCKVTANVIVRVWAVLCGLQLCSCCSLAKNLHVDSLFPSPIFILGFFFFPHCDCQFWRLLCWCWSQHFVLGCYFILDAQGWYDGFVLSPHPLLLITHLAKAELGALGSSATARRSKLGNAVWSGQRNKENCQLFSRALEFTLCCCPLPAFVSVFSPK